MDVLTARPTESDRHAALARTTGIIGIAFLVLLFGPIIALASAGEPALEATAAEAAKYFGNIEATWAQQVMAASTLGMIGSLWFFVAFGFCYGVPKGIRLGVRPSRLCRARCWRRTGWSAPAGRRPRCTEGGSPPRSPTLRTRPATSASRTHGSPSPASPCCSGWVILSTGVLERWMGWWVVVAGLGLVVARFVWTTGFWGVGYTLFWLWVIVVCIRLIRRPDRWNSAAR